MPKSHFSRAFEHFVIGRENMTPRKAASVQEQSAATKNAQSLILLPILPAILPPAL